VPPRAGIDIEAQAKLKFGALHASARWTCMQVWARAAADIAGDLAGKLNIAVAAKVRDAVRNLHTLRAKVEHACAAGMTAAFVGETRRRVAAHGGMIETRRPTPSVCWNGTLDALENAVNGPCGSGAASLKFHPRSRRHNAHCRYQTAA
jgi:hypothetical protein